ncbi:unnamed protein product [Phyllotreta striolata]|uniref:DUF2428 domain-containing protein n=1 Tax=Phyllotreta striolata TaxID=444603 RepID=A0A9N9TGE1_PHYSR|nr:unnamed protein product [Phyllotreta striolata]
MLGELLISVEKSCIEDQISALLLITSSTQYHLDPVEIEAASKVFSRIYKSLYKNDFETFKELLTSNSAKIESFTIKIYNKPLWYAIVCNSLKTLNLTNEDSTSDFFLWIINFVLEHIDLLDKNSLYLLRTLQQILNRTNLLSSGALSYSVIQAMNRIAVSPLYGFKQLACSISKIALQFIDCEESELFDINNLPVKGVHTFDIVELYSDSFVQRNIENIAKKVLMMFLNHIENKDGGILYVRLLSSCAFEQWVNLIWPVFISNLREIEYEGEFFQSLIKYWIPFTVNSYKSDFYTFIRGEPVALRLKAYILLESRKNGVLFKHESVMYNQIETMDLALNIISTYRKKSLCPGVEETNFLLNYLYSNLKSYLEDDEILCVRKFFSQLIVFAHSDLKKSDKNLDFYRTFVRKIFDYSLRSFRSEFFEVGAQVLYNFFNILKGSYRELKLIYKLEKKDNYEKGDNLLFIKLNEDLRNYQHRIFPEIKNCVSRINFHSLILTNLITQHFNYPFITKDLFESILADAESVPNLQNCEKIINSSNLLFTQFSSKESYELLEKIENMLLKNLESKHPEEKDLFKKVLYLEILVVAKQRKLRIKHMHKIVEKCLDFIILILESDFLSEISYRCGKVVETFITRVLFMISQNIQELSPISIIVILQMIIERSNMKKPVSLSAELMRQLLEKLEEEESGKLFKSRLLNQTLDAIDNVQSNNIKIRRNPESRLVIHAICVSQKDPKKSLLHWTMERLLMLIGDPETTDLSAASSLHTIELLMSDNRLQNQTLRYIPAIIVRCVELFIRSNWVVRNANLQLTKSILERLYGVSISNNYRPKNISDILVLYPWIGSYFFRILSSKRLDDRAVIVLQFFSESYIKETLFEDNIAEIVECLRVLLVHIIKNYPNQYGKLAVKSFASICPIGDIPAVFADIASYIARHFAEIPKNIFANLALLMQELHEKYEVSYKYRIDSNGMEYMRVVWLNLTTYLNTIRTDLFDYLLIKVKSVREILSSGVYDKNNMWFHNNLPYLFLNANCEEICAVLDDRKFLCIPEYCQVKMLSIFVQRFENNEFSLENLERIKNALFQVALSISDDKVYLLNCYFKCLTIFCGKTDDVFETSISISTNLHKNMIALLRISKNPSNNSFFNAIMDKIKRNISINEDLDNDIISVLTIIYPKLPKHLCSDVLKIILYYSSLNPTHLGAYHFISKNSRKNYGGILQAICSFYRIDNLREHLGDEFTVKNFLSAVNKFLQSNSEEFKCDGEFYAIENDVLIPKTFLKTLFKCRRCFPQSIENKLI